MKRIIAIVVLISLIGFSEAKVVLPSLFTDNMVLQRDTRAPFWGKATPGSIVKILTSWNKSKYSVKVKEDSTWMISIQTPGAGGPYTLSFTDDETITLSNVLIGDVFLCSGQSNMEMKMKGYVSQPVDHNADRIVNAKPSKPIRIFSIPRTCSTYPLDRVNCKWEEHTREAVANVSAVSYYFAETMQNALEIPIGIIVASWGGTTIEAWMTEESLEKCCPGEFKFDHLGKRENSQGFEGREATMYNGQIAPLIPFSIKGLIWYQGESNRTRYKQYTRLQPEYVSMMREKFQSPDAGFYFVQIAPHLYDNDPNGWGSGYFCEAQASTLKTIPHSGMATTLDIGDDQTIHPHQKPIVGQRLAYIALYKDYGFTEIEAEAPTYKSMTIKDNKIIIEFDNCHEGISPIVANIPGFEIAGEDRVFHKADAFNNNPNRQQVNVSSKEVPNPVAVRFCFRNFQSSTLKNNFGIPVGPFRTDDWE